MCRVCVQALTLSNETKIVHVAFPDVGAELSFKRMLVVCFCHCVHDRVHLRVIDSFCVELGVELRIRVLGFVLYASRQDSTRG